MHFTKEILMTKGLFDNSKKCLKLIFQALINFKHVW